MKTVTAITRMKTATSRGQPFVMCYCTLYYGDIVLKEEVPRSISRLEQEEQDAYYLGALARLQRELQRILLTRRDAG